MDSDKSPCDVPGTVPTYVGVDDTDSLQGLCTTYLATELVRGLGSVDLIGYPRLVRLNPNVPWKTRGNGAICLAVGRGLGRSFGVGRIDGTDVRAYQRGDPVPDPARLIDRLADIVERWSDIEAPGTDPGLVVLERKPAPSLYWHAARGIVPPEEARRAIDGLGHVRTWKSGRGIIGASAACAWRPRDRTWEVLAYRRRERWGTPRRISAGSVRAMDRRYSSTFNSYDYENGRIVIAPSTPCPVLFGIRGEDASELPAALAMVRGERPERWLVFETNQGTDDHVQPAPVTVPRSAGRYSGRVTRPPRTLPGGHVVFAVGPLEVSAYEPSKQFRNAVRALAPGDRVEVIGSVREDPRTINLEKLRVVSLARLHAKVANPKCPACGVHMKSRGHLAPFRCRRCRRTLTRSHATVTEVPRRLRTGWYEPPVGSRRHLSKPLKRGGSQRR